MIPTRASSQLHVYEYIRLRFISRSLRTEAGLSQVTSSPPTQQSARQILKAFNITEATNIRNIQHSLAHSSVCLVCSKVVNWMTTYAPEGVGVLGL